jgi:hypothetical protein
MTQLNTINRPDTLAEMTTSAEVLNPLHPVSDALGRVFASSQEQSRIQKIRGIMGDLVADLADEELEVYVTEFQYLIDEWLDDFERQTFDGRALRQALNQE